MLPRFPVHPGVAIAPLPGGLINRTYLISDVGPPPPVAGQHGSTTAPRRFVLQQVNPIFPAAIHENISAVTRALEQAHLVTPALIPTVDGQSCLRLQSRDGDEPDSVWRLMTYVEGVSFDVVSGTAQARAAGALVARFHAAVGDLAHRFVGLRVGAHDTPRHLAQLARSARGHGDHRLFASVAELADAIQQAAVALPALPELSPRVCHGDLKFNNLLFAGPEVPLRDQAVCLIDLDTVGPMKLAYEMGDAWRSWCNRNGEDVEWADLDLERFEASLDGYREGLGRPLTSEERGALLLGPDWISLELSARFAADAVEEAYFGWDAQRFAGRGEHNLVRARGQLSLHQQLVSSRPKRSQILGCT